MQFLGHPIANDTVYGEPKIWVRTVRNINTLQITNTVPIRNVNYNCTLQSRGLKLERVESISLLVRNARHPDRPLVLKIRQQKDKADFSPKQLRHQLPSRHQK